MPGLHNIADRGTIGPRKFFEVGRKKWRIKLKSLKKKSKEKERENRKEENDKK
jgi:hypothetical protein